MIIATGAAYRKLPLENLRGSRAVSCGTRRGSSRRGADLSADDLAAAKVAVLAASLLSSVVGVAVLWRAPPSATA